jgi:succinoglycan biosynthesis transport protein ExoP
MTERPPNRPPAPPGLNLSLGDVYHILFRHKWKILLISGLGLIGSVLLPIVKKVPYTSEAKLYIRYVLESSSPTPDASDPRIKLPDTRGESIINTELEILTSLDLAQQVADAVGPERILGAGVKDHFTAGAVVHKGLIAEVAKNSCVIRLTFQHADPEIVQPVLQQLIELYVKKHAEIHAVGAFDDFLTQETDQLRSDLAKTEQELGRAKTNLGYYASLEDAKKFQGEEISRIRQALFEAEAELAERKAAASELVNLTHVSPDAATNTMNKVAAPSVEKVAEYKRLLNQLDSLYKREQDDSLVFTSESAWMNALHKQITNNGFLKAQLEKENPGLIAVGVSESKRADTGSNSRADFSAEKGRVLALNSKIAVLNEQLERLQKEAASVSGVEGTITKLQLQKEIEEGRYKHFVKGLEQARIDEKIGNGKVSNITPIQKPSPPFRDGSKLQKARMAVAVAGFAFGVGLAFLLEMFVDRSVKNGAEIEGKLGLPLFLTVPLIHENGNGLGWFRNVPLLNHRNDHGHGNRRKALPEREPDSVVPPEEPNASDSLGLGLENHNSQLPLGPFFEALRDRLIGFFEIKNLTHKPKLVAVTSCREGAGVSTFASGLAASLSETGDGNVLLVDMCQRNGAPRHFLGGHLNCGLDEVLESETRNSALVQDNLYVVSESGNGAMTGQGKLARILPKRFTNLMPKLKASDYDYIIFDMPPVNQLSVTPRIAKFMDIVLLVIESEKTDRDVVKRAVALLGESKPNLGAVLNKRRSYVPKVLQQEV